MKNKKAHIEWGFWLGPVVFIIALLIGVGVCLFIVIMEYREMEVIENLCENNDLEYIQESIGFIDDKYFCVGYKNGELVKYQVLKVKDKYELYKGGN